MQQQANHSYVGTGVRTAAEVQRGITSTMTHFEKHGFSLCSVYEKASHNFIGRSGIIYLAYDDTQPDIEIGFILAKAYWHQGYATELGRALIHWGFSNLTVNKLVGITHPDNLASQQALQKVGMHLCGLSTYNNLTVTRFEINSPNW